METTRHFVATVYVVNDGATLLHEHDKLGLWLPPGGHIDRDELPHAAARREAREETGLSVSLLSADGVESPTARELPRPRHVLLEDINVHEDGTVGHQHVDHVYYATADSRELAPAEGEAPADAWEWVGREALGADRFDPDVTAFGREAIAAAADAGDAA